MAFEITIPRLGWSMEEGVFAGWQKKDGDFIKPGDILFELEGEKALQEIEALDEGILRIPPDGPQTGSVLKVGAVVGYLLAKGETLLSDSATHKSVSNKSSASESAVLTSATADQKSAATSEENEAANTDPAAPPSVRRLARQMNVSLATICGTGPGGRITESDVTLAAARSQTAVTETSANAITSTPRARRAAKRLGIAIEQVNGTGRNGRIRERDILRASNSTASPGSSGQPGNRISISGRRRIIADRLSESARQTVPVTLNTRADATNLVSLREQFKGAGQTPLPTFNDIIAKLVAGVLIQFPLLGGRWDGDSVVLPEPDQIHIGLAVDTPDGLIVPVLRDVSSHSLIGLAAESAKVIQKARIGRLSGSEMQGAVFTITNLGGFGIDAFTPVINLPETAILGLGAIRKEPVVADDGKIQIRHLMTLSLTFDHRVIDGAPAARFLQTLVSAIENAAARLIAGS